MDQNSRNRVPGLSDKKRRFGRTKKRPRIFYKKQQDEALLEEHNVSARQSSTNFSMLPSAPRAKISRIIAEASSSSRFIEEDLAGTPPKTSKNSISRSRQKIKSTYLIAGQVQNRILDISLLFPCLKNFLACKNCGANVEFIETDIRGLGSRIVISCTNNKCNKITYINSSNKVGGHQNGYEINRRAVLAMRGLGHGHAGLKTLCAIMDFPPPMAHDSFDQINKVLEEASENVAKYSMRAAMEEDCQNDDTQDGHHTVSGDGSWRKRGYSSLQGVVSLIRNANGKVIDVAPKHSQCKECNKHPEEDSEKYREWFDGHQQNCFANHHGSSGKMEVDGVIEMFRRSEEIHGVKYKNYIGDGDSKVYKALCNNKPYGESFIIEKKECVGHVQKRMGTRLRNLKKNLSGKKLSDGKYIGGKDRLTGHRIDQLTKYYGTAIRGHSNSVSEMSKAIWATFYHKKSTDENPTHHLCPLGSNSWCKWQVAKTKNKLKNFHHSDSIAAAIMDVIKPIYEDLTQPDLLQRCIGGYTQNNNESFNHSIWKLVPKHNFSGLRVLKIGVYIAVSCFNDGKAAILQVMKQLNADPGSSAVRWAMTEDTERLFWSDKRAACTTLEARRAQRKRKHPDDFYSAGAN